MRGRLMLIWKACRVSCQLRRLPDKPIVRPRPDGLLGKAINPLQPAVLLRQVLRPEFPPMAARNPILVRPTGHRRTTRFEADWRLTKPGRADCRPRFVFARVINGFRARPKER